MMHRSEMDGLRFDPLVRRSYAEHHSFTDKLHDSRLGLGRLYYWKPRDVDGLSRAVGISEPAVHISVIERLAYGLGSYAPGNIPPHARVVTTREAEGHGVEAVCAAIRSAHAENGGVLDGDLTTLIRAGQVACLAYLWLFVLAASQLLVLLRPALMASAADVANATPPLPSWIAFWPLAAVYELATGSVGWWHRMLLGGVMLLPDFGYEGRFALLGAALCGVHRPRRCACEAAAEARRDVVPPAPCAACRVTTPRAADSAARL